MSKRQLVTAILLSFFVGLTTIGWTSDLHKKSDNKSTKIYKSENFTIFNVNNLRIPLDNKGVLADVDPGDGTGAGGTYNNIVVLFSGGFFLSGYDNGVLWANGVLTCSRIEDYQPGPVGVSSADPKNKIYVVKKQDIAFSQSWQDWRDAVSIGADYYDGDGDGTYNPVDLNSNGNWDTNEDRPDLIGDWTAWCVYNDGVPAALRIFNDVAPKGIEIHQTVFGYGSDEVIGNVMFIRYRLVNSGSVSDKLDNVYFGAAVDPDIGTYDDDFIGCDTTLNVGYVYNNGSDLLFGANPPSFIVDLLQGPVTYMPRVTFLDVNGDGIFSESIDIALDTAYSAGGIIKGVKKYPGAKNLSAVSFTGYMHSHPVVGDPTTPIQLRNIMMGGKGNNGDSLYVSTWALGNGAALGIDTAMICARYMYSGDPVNSNGWLNTAPLDQKQISNIGPFQLQQENPVDIYVGYIIGQGSDPLNSITIAKQNDLAAQRALDENFPFVIVGVEDETNKNYNFKLNQNYPNPFNPTTTISFSLQSKEFVTLKIYDVLGEEVITLVNEELNTGSYKNDWNATNLSSGVYFYRLQAGNFSETKKLLFLK
ncbi:MAG: T9SS type A sorting domain-containing protein [bacterium]